jgi:hypothetical protein
VAAADIADFELSEVRDSLRGLRYGAVEIIVQDGVIVQIKRRRGIRQRDAVYCRRSASLRGVC